MDKYDEKRKNDHGEVGENDNHRYQSERSDIEECTNDELDEKIVLALLTAFNNIISDDDDIMTDDNSDDFFAEDDELDLDSKTAPLDGSFSCSFVCESESGEPLTGCSVAQACIAVAQVKIRSLESRIAELKERLTEYEDE